MKAVRAVPAQMMFLELRFMAASTDCREAASTAAIPTSGERQRHKCRLLPVSAFCLTFLPPTFPSAVCLSLASISCKRRWPLVVLFRGWKNPSTGWMSQCTSQVCFWPRVWGRRQPACCVPGLLLAPVAGDGRNGSNRRQQWWRPNTSVLEIESPMGAAHNSSHCFAGAFLHFRHTQLQS